MKEQWPDRTEYPFQSNYVTINGHQLHYIDEGAGDIILSVHGTPSWSFDFRNVVKVLRNRFRCIAIDHIGFGLSDKPGNYDYSTQNHSRTLEKFIVDQDLTDITLVVHDFGGPIGLHAAMLHPERIKKLVVLNSWLWSNEQDPDYIKLKKILKSPLLPFLYRYLNFSPRFILPRSFGKKQLSRRILQQYTLPFKKINERSGPLAFARSLLHDQPWFEALWQKRYAIKDKPALFVWGMKDPLVKPRHLDRFLSGFPNARSVTLDSCGHFPQEEQPGLVADAISGFLGAHDPD